jgi:hypothetical protein
LPEKFKAGTAQDDWWVTMTAAVATDDSGGPVQYYFQCVNLPGFSSGWIDLTTYEVQIGGEHVYTEWRVKARDAAGNETAWSPKQPATDPNL